MGTDTSTILQKALTINLDNSNYGTLTEIGAGQEVARFFFQAGGASGTIAKSMSAYDKAVSDAIYGEEESGRYVCKHRVEKMIQREFDLLIERVSELRPKSTTFFAFADTIAARSYSRKDNHHGWMGIRLQLYPGAPPSQIVLHVRMFDAEPQAQQELIGVLGVNLIHSALYLFRQPYKLIESLAETIARDRFEIDVIEFQGPYFEELDSRLANVHLVEHGISSAVMFGPDGHMIEPSEALYKHNVLVIRGSFRPVTYVNVDMMNCGIAQFQNEPNVRGDKMVTVAEITTATLISGGKIDPRDFLTRVDSLGALGYTVLISNYLRYFRLQAYLRRYTRKMIGIVLGIPNLRDIFTSQYYEGLEGGILEAFGKLFSDNTRLYVYPARNRNNEELTTIENIDLPQNVKYLYQHLIHNRFIVGMEGYRTDLFHIFSRDVLNMLKQGPGEWEKMVPESVAEQIKKNRLYGYDSE